MWEETLTQEPKRESLNNNKQPTIPNQREIPLSAARMSQRVRLVMEARRRRPLAQNAKSNL